ncbi:endonuclease III [Amphiplicatus metriothermophilus]|uniref:Endonuclease III n=1 Tax=Amphiplicatus metriothermophilus TaxID=1519374 RepID=A0A239PKU3_9PROT|nr:endonuclease III [Amphiplicatus metriothermophilus]MBB5517992.1 endonuclease III [Amphiplicatus metriothermophilus]SNT67674.1 DNA-(apurinic or apyrimidinic site) lyase /endonuclease III [Amphiplicatus metriothermophilus]
MPRTLTRTEAEKFFARLAARDPAPETELNYTNPYTLLVAVVLSAQATDVGVNKATARLFQIADSPEKMVALGEKKLGEHVRTIGLWRNKAKNVIALSKILIERHGGKVPADREALEKLPGVGRKTANVVCNVAFGQPTIAVDTHIFRVANRTGLAPGRTPLEVERALEKITPKKYLRGAHHWLILHGRYVCKARRPDCPNCVVADLCLYPDKTAAHARKSARDEEKIECRTPTPGRASVRIPRWKYEAVRRAILDALKTAGEEGFAFKELPDAVKARLSAEELESLGSVSWWTTTVKLDMEVKGEIERVVAKGGQRLRLVPRRRVRKGAAA